MNCAECKDCTEIAEDAEAAYKENVLQSQRISARIESRYYMKKNEI